MSQMNPAQESVKRVYNPFLGALAKLLNGTVNFVMSVCLSDSLPASNSAPTGWIFMKFGI
jgi:hypothetical protein